MPRVTPVEGDSINHGNSKTRPVFIRMVLSAVLAFLSIITTAAAQEHAADDPDFRTEDYEADDYEAGADYSFESMTIESGLIFLNGEAMMPPFQVTVKNEAIRINDQLSAAIKSPFRDSTRRSEVREADKRPGRRRPGQPGGQPRGRGQGQGPGRSRVQTDERALSALPTSRSSLNRAAADVRQALDGDAVVVLFDDQVPRYYYRASERAALFEGLLYPGEHGSIDDEFRELIPQGAQTVWNSWRTGFLEDAPPEAVEQMQADVDASASQAAADARLLSARRLLEQLSYPLTITAMLVSVFATGHLLQWAGAGITDSTAGRRVTIAIALITVMSVVDLSWTTLATQADAMKEVNPIAASLTDSPVGLALFKIVATGTGLSILFLARHHVRMQQAAWWLCLVCVLLTFRWVMFQSMTV